jgi:Gpi18-like mannosyltransferase
MELSMEQNIAIIVVVGSLALAYLTHVIWTIRELARACGDEHEISIGRLVLGLIGIFIIPIGILHGLLKWFRIA